MIFRLPKNAYKLIWKFKIGKLISKQIIEIFDRLVSYNFRVFFVYGFIEEVTNTTKAHTTEVLDEGVRPSNIDIFN
jgi:hypothetical protein